MLLLDSNERRIEGVSIFADSADDSMFWYLGGPLQLATGHDNRKRFSLIKYKPAAVEAGVKGGGFLSFEVNLALDREIERRILSRLRRVSRGRPKLAPVPFTDGTVQCMALNLQGSGGTTATPAPEGGFNAVERIIGAAKPSLLGDNTASFALTLSQEGVVLVEQALEQGALAFGVLYDLTFTGMRPALNVKITAELERVYSHFSTSADTQTAFTRAGVDIGFEKLLQDGAIKIEVMDAKGDAETKEREEWALNFFKDSLLAQWFQPTLQPGQLAGGAAAAESLDAVLRRGNALKPEPTPAPARPGPADEVPAETPRSAPEPSPAAGTGVEAPTSAPATGAAGENASPAAGTGFPAESAQAAPAGAGATAPGQSSLRSATDRSGEPGMVSAFRLKRIRQEERKTLTLEYARSQAETRTYAPQGFLAAMVRELDRERHIVEADLDAPFFQTLSVGVDAPFDFRRIGLNSAEVTIDYGDPGDPETHKHADLVFREGDGAEQRFTTFLTGDFSRRYNYRVQYHFDPDSDWQGRSFSFEGEPVESEDESLHLNPHEIFTFAEIEIAPDRIDGGIVEAIDVQLAFTHPDGAEDRKTVTVLPDSGSQFWKLRIRSEEMLPFTYRLVHTLKDGSVREDDPVETLATKIAVNDPFPAAIDALFFSAFDPSSVRTVFIQVDYEDRANNYGRSERLRVDPDTLETPLHLAILDPDKRRFTYQITMVGANGRIHRADPVDTEETLISIPDFATGEDQ